MPKLSNVSSPKEVAITPAATVIQGELYINGDTNAPFVASATHSASAEAAVQGISSSIKAIDMNARVGAYPSTGLCIFETLG